jgi:hypothetical protein
MARKFAEIEKEILADPAQRVEVQKEKAAMRAANGHAEYRITISMAGYGQGEDAAESFLEGFLEKHPETGPVVSQNRVADTISVTFSLKAGGQEHALNLGQVVWVEGGAASGLEPTRVVRAEIESVEDAAEDQAPAGERVPA